MSVFTNPASAAAEHAAAYVAAVLGLLGEASPWDVLASTPEVLRDRLRSVAADVIYQQEGPGKWSAAAVVQHLADSELVFGFRLRMVLAHDKPQLPGYDQDLWADRLDYREADPESALTMFSMLRHANLNVLGRCSPVDLERVSVHAERGEESLMHMIRLYAGHDLLHVRQVERILTTTK